MCHELTELKLFKFARLDQIVLIYSSPLPNSTSFLLEWESNKIDNFVFLPTPRFSNTQQKINKYKQITPPPPVCWLIKTEKLLCTPRVP